MLSAELPDAARILRRLVEPAQTQGEIPSATVTRMLELFISWSGDKSRAVALALAEWLPGVINNVQPFVSANDIYAGARWQVEIAGRLETSKFGVVCVTKENQASTWLNFEAGALAKAVDSSRVVPLAIDLKPSDIQTPLGQFQAQPATQEGIGKVLASINAACDPRLPEALLARATVKWWPDLQATLRSIEKGSGGTPKAATPTRSDRELLEEMLDAVRSLAAQGAFDTPARRDGRRRLAARLTPITIDISAFVGAAGRHAILADNTTTVADLLNSTYFALQNTVRPFTYGSEWILRDSRGKYLDQLSSAWSTGAAPSLKVDERCLVEAGVSPGSMLVAEKLPRPRPSFADIQPPSSTQATPKATGNA